MSSDAGEQDPQTPGCQECGTPATPGARFCRSCGVALIVRPTAAPAAASGAPSTGRAPVDDETTGELERIGHTTGEVTPPQGLPALRPCPNCGGPNSPHRELCGRCGADLETGTLPPRADPRATPPTGAPPPHEEPSRSRLVAALGVLLVLGLLIGGLAYAGVGPFGGDDLGVPSATFDEGAYTVEPDRLAIAEIATLTTLPAQGGQVYDASQMVDDDAGTAWNSDGADPAAENGVGERIELVLESPAWVERLVIRNGDQRDADAYAANGRIRRAQVTLDGGIVLLINLLDEGLSAQAVELTEPVLTTGMRIEVLDTFPGDTHPDLAVSDLELQGWPAQGEDLDLAQRRAQAQPATAQPET